MFVDRTNIVIAILVIAIIITILSIVYMGSDLQPLGDKLEFNGVDVKDICPTCNCNLECPNITIPNITCGNYSVNCEKAEYNLECNNTAICSNCTVGDCEESFLNLMCVGMKQNITFSLDNSYTNDSITDHKMTHEDLGIYTASVGNYTIKVKVR